MAAGSGQLAETEMQKRQHLQCPQKVSLSYVRAALEQTTTRDRAILDTIYENAVVSTQQIRLVHFPDVAETNPAPVSRRMALLRRLGFTDIKRMAGDRRNFHMLGPAGISFMANQWKQRPDSLRRSYMSRVSSDMFLNHRLAITDLYADLKVAEHRDAGSLLMWQSDGAFWFVFRFLGCDYKLYPDARGSWLDGTTGEQVDFLFEVDLGTESYGILERKFGKYLLLLKSRGFAAYQGRPTFPVLLVITSSPGRAAMLGERWLASVLQAKLLPGDVNRFMTVAFTDLQTLKGRNIFDELWVKGIEGGPPVRLEELPPPEYISRSSVSSKVRVE